MRFALLAAFVASAALASKAPAPAVTGQTGQTVATDPLGRGTWVSDEELDRVVLVGDSGEQHAFDVGQWPDQIVVDAQGRAFVSCRQSGTVAVIGADFEVTKIPVGAEPHALALDEANHRLFVGLYTERALAALDTESLQVVARRSFDGEPQALAVTPQGLAVLPRRGSQVTWVDPSLSTEGKFDWSVDLGNRVPVNQQQQRRVQVSERKPWHGQALISVGRDLLIFHQEVDTGLQQPVASGGYGGSVSSPVITMVSLLRDAQPIEYPFDFSDFRQLPVSDITGAAYKDGVIVLASRGTASLFAMPADLKHLTLSDGVTLSEGDGLTGVAFDAKGRIRSYAAFDRRLVAASYVAEHTRMRKDPVPVTAQNCSTLASAVATNVEVVPTELVAHKSVFLGKGKLDDELRIGRALFHRTDVTGISLGGLGCVSCHPDGREDGLVWRVKGTRRQTPLLAGRLKDTAPYNWAGTTRTLEENITQTIERLGGDGLTARQKHALARYINEGLRPVSQPAPAVDNGVMVAEGKKLFHDDVVGCASCHPSDAAFTDAAEHDVESVSAKELTEMKSVDPKAKVPEFNTPDLRHLAVSAPYFHDGSVKTLEDLVEQNHDRMGKTSQLSKEQKSALVAYLKSL